MALEQTYFSPEHRRFPGHGPFSRCPRSGEIADQAGKKGMVRHRRPGAAGGWP